MALILSTALSQSEVCWQDKLALSALEMQAAMSLAADGESEDELKALNPPAKVALRHINPTRSPNYEAALYSGWDRLEPHLRLWPRKPPKKLAQTMMGLQRTWQHVAF